LPETQGSEALPGILADIVRAKRSGLEGLVARMGALEERASHAAPPRDFGAAISVPGTVSLIAECKRRSPGAGPIRPDLDPGELCRGYERAGASALSVLTDEDFFGGGMADLRTAKARCTLPVLRKDFTLDPAHVVEARAGGADAVLLIVRILSDSDLRRLHDEATKWGMAALVEVHDRAELGRALDLGARIVGINNRDLATFRTDLGTTLSLLEDVPDEVIVVSESGIRTQDDVARLGDRGVDAVLVGETLLRATDPAQMARELSGVASRERVHG